MESGSEADRGVVVAGGLVGAHRDPSPLLELVEGAFYDVAAAVALPLLRAELDRPTGSLATVSDLVGPLGDRRGDTAFT